MSDKKEKKQQEKEKIKEFLKDFDRSQVKKEQNKPVEEKKNNGFTRRPYQCPSCHKLLISRKEPCEYCGYSGYIPMSEHDTKKVRTVLFVVLLIVAIVVYWLTHR